MFFRSAHSAGSLAAAARAAHPGLALLVGRGRGVVQDAVPGGGLEAHGGARGEEADGGGARAESDAGEADTRGRPDA